MTQATGSPEPLLHALAGPASRAAAADALAARLGVDAVLLYVKDPQLDVMLPAPGMPKTISGGSAWRAFLGRCGVEECPLGEVDLLHPVRDRGQIVVGKVGEQRNGAQELDDLHLIHRSLP